MSVRDKLKALKKGWKDADPEANEFEQVPKGDYTGAIYDAEATESSNDNPMLKLQIAIDSPGFEGRYVWDNIVFTEKSIGIAKQKLFRLGINVDEMDIEDLEAVAEELRGMAVSFRLTYKANADDPDADPWSRIKYRSPVEEEEDERPARGRKATTKKTSKKTTKKKGKREKKF